MYLDTHTCPDERRQKDQTSNVRIMEGAKLEKEDHTRNDVVMILKTGV